MGSRGLSHQCNRACFTHLKVIPMAYTIAKLLFSVIFLNLVKADYFNKFLDETLDYGEERYEITFRDETIKGIFERWDWYGIERFFIYVFYGLYGLKLVYRGSEALFYEMHEGTKEEDVAAYVESYEQSFEKTVQFLGGVMLYTVIRTMGFIWENEKVEPVTTILSAGCVVYGFICRVILNVRFANREKTEKELCRKCQRGELCNIVH